MQLGNESLNPYFQRELHALREAVTDFSEDHPGIARELGLARGESRDPQVELLIQSFSWLIGRLNFRLDEERGLLPNLLLGLLYPHLQAPLPSMVVAKLAIKADGANFAEGWTLRRGRQIYAMPVIQGGTEISCRLRCIYDTPLLPLEVNSVAIASANELGKLGQIGQANRQMRTRSVLRVNICRDGEEDIKNLNLSRLRFHLHDKGLNRYKLYDLLSRHCTGVAVRANKSAGHQWLDKSAIRWLGFDPERENALPANPQTHPGFRLLQEYFSFREKFLFFEIEGINAGNAEGELELLFMLKEPPEADHQIRRDALQLNCVPLVNLYPQRLEPLHLDQRSYEHRLTGNRVHHRYCEIHTIQELSALQADGSERELAPYFSARLQHQQESHDFFYLTRRAQSPLPSTPGTELHASFLDSRLDLARPPGDIIVGRALCTNRRLPEHLNPGDRLELEGAGPVEGIELLGKPSAHRSPRVLGNEPWALLAQLAPNYLSLSAHTDSLGALKRMLQLHSNAEIPDNAREIDGLASLKCQPAVKYLRGRNNVIEGMARGLSMNLVVNPEAFDSGSALLFGEVLQHFLSLYVAVNNFTTLTLEGGKSEGVIKSWLPMTGDRIVL